MEDSVEVVAGGVAGVAGVAGVGAALDVLAVAVGTVVVESTATGSVVQAGIRKISPITNNKYLTLCSIKTL